MFEFGVFLLLVFAVVVIPSMTIRTLIDRRETVDEVEGLASEVDDVFMNFPSFERLSPFPPADLGYDSYTVYLLEVLADYDPYLPVYAENGVASVDRTLSHADNRAYLLFIGGDEIWGDRLYTRRELETALDIRPELQVDIVGWYVASIPAVYYEYRGQARWPLLQEIV